MPIIVDTNIILDCLQKNSQWAEWSATQMSLHAQGGLLVNPLIYTELCVTEESHQTIDAILGIFDLNYVELPREALFLAAKAFLKYRKRGGTKTAPLPDFFIGAHAQAGGYSLMTRDKGRYSTYFPKVPLIMP